MINTIMIVTKVVIISEVESESVSVVLCCPCCVVSSVLCVNVLSLCC